jgi:uncharacterized membrane protein
MSTTYNLTTAEIPSRAYRIPSLSLSRPWRWLRLGWEDLRAEPGTSLTYGFFFALVGFLLTYLLIALNLFFLCAFFAAGFLILAPALVVGLYSVSKLRVEHKPHDSRSVAHILAGNASSIAEMGIILLFFFLNWIMLSNLLFGGVFQELLPTWGQVKPLPVLFTESLPFLAIYGGIAAVLGIVLFRMTAIAVPMLIDQNVDALNAIFASWKAVGENARAMTLWAVLILILVAIGFATAYLGLVVILPWLAYSSWHAYQDTLILDEPRTTPTEG